MLSREVVADVAASREVAAFVARANASLDLRTWDMGEDVALGFWVAHLGANTTFVAVPHKVPNLGCAKRNGLYKHPSNKSAVIHFAKTPGAMRYLWEVVHGGAAHDPRRCVAMAGVD